MKSSASVYFGADESALFCLWCFFEWLWCFEVLLVAGAADVSVEGVSAAYTGPASRIRLRTGTTCLNIEKVSKRLRVHDGGPMVPPGALILRQWWLSVLLNWLSLSVKSRFSAQAAPATRLNAASPRGPMVSDPRTRLAYEPARPAPPACGNRPAREDRSRSRQPGSARPACAAA